MLALHETIERLSDPTQITDWLPRRAFEYWLAKRRGGRLPDRADLDPVEIPRLLPFVSLIQALPDEPGDFLYRLVGTAMVQMAGRDMTGKRVSDVPHPSMREMARRTFARCLDGGGEPLHHIIRAPWFESELYERVLLPLRHGGDGPAMVLLAVSERATPLTTPFYEFGASGSPR